MNNVLIIDGNALAFSKKPDPDKIPHNKIFSNIHGGDIFIPRKFIKKIIDMKFYSHTGYHIIVAFDTKEKDTFRHKMDPEYKNKSISDKQAEIKEYVYQSIEVVKKYLDALNIPYYSSPQWEADDVIGMLVEKFEKTAKRIEVLTVDEDILQLVSKKTAVTITREKESTTYNQQAIFDKFGYKNPKMIIQRKALMGDKSDNIKNYGYDSPPIRNINKYSQQLLIKYQDVDTIYNNLPSIKQPYRDIFIKGKERAYHNLKLVTIVRDWSIDVDFEHFTKTGMKKKRLHYVVEDLNLQELYKKTWFRWGYKKFFHEFPPTDKSKNN